MDEAAVMAEAVRWQYYYCPCQFFS